MKQEKVKVLRALNAGQTAHQSILFDKKFVKAVMDDIFADEAYVVQAPREGA